VNWYNIGAVLPLVSATLSVGPAQLGVVLGAFLLGVGIFQVPAGFAAIRFGARRVSIAGVLVLGIAGVVSALSPDWPTLAVIRFLGGVGAAFFFAPALSLIASYFPPGRRGPVIGLYNGGFSIGGAIGLFGGALLGAAYGWRVSLAVGGIALLAITLITWGVLPREEHESAPQSTSQLWVRGRGVLRSRSIWALSLGLTGFWGASYIVAQYFVDFGAREHPDWGIGLVASLAATVVIVSFPGGPVGGWIAERGRDRRLLVGALTGIAGALVLAVPFLPLVALAAAIVVLGFVEGMVFAILYLIPAYLPESQGDGLALGVGVVNSIQVILGSGIAVIFGVLVALYGYTVAWEFAGVLTVGVLPLLLFVTPNRAPRSVGSLASAPPP